MPKALVVDDSEVERLLIGGLLEEQLGLDVEYAADGREGLKRLDAGADFDLVITDLLMPEEGELGIVGRIKGQAPDLPVIIVTARGSEELAVRALRQGADSYVPKRLIESELKEIVEGVLSAAQKEIHRSRVMGSMTTCRCSFSVQSDRSLFGSLVSYLQEHLASLEICDDADLTRVGVAIEEALSNAAEHGNLELDSGLRETDRAQYDALTEERMRAAPFAERRVHLEAQLSTEQATFVIRDEGKGFDPATLPDPTDPENLLRASGRGVMLMRTFMDDVSYDATGREVTLVKRRTKS